MFQVGQKALSWWPWGAWERRNWGYRSKSLDELGRVFHILIVCEWFGMAFVGEVLAYLEYLGFE